MVALHEHDNEAIWNTWNQPAPEPFTVQTDLSPKVKQKVLKIREELYKIQKALSGLNCLHVEAAALSRFLYRSYRALRKDKAFQLLKMIMTSLKKYLRMDLVGKIDILRHALPPRFSLLAESAHLPSQTAIGWMLSIIQALAALFYRIYKLTKRAGKFLYMRLRLNWNSAVLVMCLGMLSRIHVITRHLVLKAVGWYTVLTPFVKTFAKTTAINPFKDYPKDLKTWLGGLEDLEVTKAAPSTTLDLVFQLIDLTVEDQNEEEERGFVEIIKDFGEISGADDDVKRLFEVVGIESLAAEQQEEHDCSVEFESLQKRVEAEDIGEVVHEKSVAVISDSDSESKASSVVVLSPALPDVVKSSKSRKRKRDHTMDKREQRDKSQTGSTTFVINTRLYPVSRKVKPARKKKKQKNQKADVRVVQRKQKGSTKRQKIKNEN